MMRVAARGADNSSVEGIYAYPRCPFREVAHAATRRSPALRRLSGALWPAARRAEWLRLTDLQIEWRGLARSDKLRWEEIESVHLLRRGRAARLVIVAEDGRQVVVAGTMPEFVELTDRVGQTIETWSPLEAPRGWALRLRAGV
jgi:hypothetical protein